MKLKMAIRFFLILALLVPTFDYLTHAAVSTTPARPEIVVPPSKVPGDMKTIPDKGKEGVAPNCADPAAIRINVKLLSRSSSTVGVFQIEGIVRNLGRVRFTPPDFVIVNLYEVPAGGTARRLAQTRFRNLEPNQEVKIVYDKKDFSTSLEFFPSYRLEIQHGPDDASDCRTNNNRLTREGAEIQNAVLALLR